ncbi:MAG: nucleotidyltransferase domain-containing protein [Nanoarchaeota archaeon]
MIIKNYKDKIKEYFMDNPTARKRFREMERELKMPLPSVIRYIKELVKEEILKKEEVGKVVFYSANRGSENFVLEKKLHNIRLIYNSGLLSYLREELSNPTIVLFGSYSKGEDTEDSDIDIYVETPSKKQINLDKFKKVLKREIQIFQYKDINEIKNNNLSNNIINGITLNNYIEVFK